MELEMEQMTIYIITLLSYQNAFVIPFRMWHNCITITSTIWKIVDAIFVIVAGFQFLCLCLCCCCFGCSSSSASTMCACQFSHFIPDFIPIYFINIYSPFLLPPPSFYSNSSPTPPTTTIP